MKSGIFVVAGIATLAASAFASSPDAWDRFRAELVQACLAEARLEDARVLVAPEGTASYGVALLSSEPAADGKRHSVVCVARKTPEGLVDVEVTPPADDWMAIQ